MTSQVHHSPSMLKYSRLIFVVGLALVIAAIVLSFVVTNTLLTMLLVLAGLVFVSVGLITALVQTTKVASKQRVAITNDTVHDPAHSLGIIETLSYLFFIR